MSRIIAKIYQSLGWLTNGYLVETDRSGLVAGHIGQTALQVEEKVNEAIGGILFIDEAYALADSSSSNDFGKEAVDTWIKIMEDNLINLSNNLSKQKDESFGNARLARNIFEKSIRKQSYRIVDADNPSEKELMTLTDKDIPQFSEVANKL